MPGISDSKSPDDIKLHLETILAADDARKVVPQGETEEAKLVRESAVLRPKLRARAEKALADVKVQVPGLSAVQIEKLTATRTGRDALASGVAALARVDAHLQSVTGEQNPLVGKRYGVYGDNPTSFGGVLRSLSMCVAEEEAIAKLAPEDDRRELAFSPLVAKTVTEAHATMQALVGAKEAARAELARGYTLKDATLDEAERTIAAVRQHLYANLPERRVDDDLYDYGFRPVQPGGGRPKRAKGDAPAKGGAEPSKGGEAPAGG